MKCAITEIITALDSATKLTVTSIIYDGSEILFRMTPEAPPSATVVAPSSAEDWLAANDPDKAPGEGYSSN